MVGYSDKKKSVNKYCKTNESIIMIKRIICIYLNGLLPFFKKAASSNNNAITERNKSLCSN